jgi:peptidoglycan/xylan/chitin deacetylase (PgdA/CDA1 family)
MPDVLELLREGRPFPEKSFLLTFDDGFREMSDVVAPILQEKGISATFFVNSAFIDNEEMCYLNKASVIAENVGNTGSSNVHEKISVMLRSNNRVSNDIISGILSIGYQQKSLLDEIANVLNIDFVEYLKTNKPYLTASQISNLIDAGFSIGAHSIDHPLYSSLSLEDQVHQTIESVQHIRNRFALDYGVFAFPHGDNHVSREYFSKVSATGLVDLSFGTA